MKYGPRGQCVTVRVERAGASLHVAVEDEGPGIPVLLRNGVWEPYRRLARDAGTAAGCGIGLSVVRDLVAYHGGSAHVQDAPGGGCRVLCVFPDATTAVRYPEPVEVG